MLLAAAALLTASSAAAPAPVHLRVEGLLESVAVISEASPRFSFVHGDLATTSFGVTQASYHITVRSTAARPRPGTPACSFWNSQAKMYGGAEGAIQTLTTPALAIGSAPASLTSTVIQTLANDLRQTTKYLSLIHI